MKRILYTLLLTAAVAGTITSCVGDLDQYPHEQTTSNTVYTSAANYKAVLGKLYNSFTTKGLTQDGDVDLSSNKGEDYMRNYFNMQECSTDEVIYTWQGGDNMSGLTYISWDANDVWVADTYYRIYYTIALCNEFLRNAGDGQIGSFSADDQTLIRQYRLEARFIRALAYSHALDLYRNIPFVTEADPVGSYLPPRYTGEQMFAFLESELTAIAPEMLDKSACEYGRAGQGAAYALLARLYLNAEVYTGTAKWSECIAACKQVLGMGYSIEPTYGKLFNADNHLRTNEIIFTFPVDSKYKATWGTTSYIICGGVNNTSDTQNPADYGIQSGWGNFRLRGEFTDLFATADKRGNFYTEGQTKDIAVVDNQGNGYLPQKWTNLTDAGEAAPDVDKSGVCTDFPVFRLADVYLMLAEAVVRGGSGSSRTEALALVNELRTRAYGDNTGNISDSQLTADFLLDERGRELYHECVRRSDLIRFGKFTTADYLWQWKGGVIDGQAVDSKYNIYPIPTTELTANPNLYNENY